MHKNLNDSKGMTIVEILVSVIIISLVMGLLFTLLIQVQQINNETSKKSTIMISQNVITKAVERDMFEIGVKTISSCTYDEFNYRNLVEENTKYDCIKIEYNQSYDVSDVGYILIYKQSNETPDASWVMRYGRGYYNNCVAGNRPVLENWKETYSVVQKLDKDVVLEINPNENTVTYSSSYEDGKKYSAQKLNSGNLYIPIMDEAGYKYDIDLSFAFKLNYPSNITVSNEVAKFTCAEKTDKLSCVCSGTAELCGKTKPVNEYFYTCSETKEKLGAVEGMNKNFISLSAVSKVGITPNNVNSISFYNNTSAFSKETIPPVDISYSQNGTVLMYYQKVNNLYDLKIVQNGGVFVYGSSLASMFSDFVKLKSVDFTGFRTNGITNMNSMFYNCPELTTLTGFNTLDFTNVDDVSLMFYKCAKLTASPFKGINLDSIVYANSTFAASGLSGTFKYNEDFDAKNVRTLKGFLKESKITSFIFDYGTETTLHLLTNMDNMLSKCSKLGEAQLSNLNLPSLKSMNNTFNASNILSKVNIKNFISNNLESLVGTFDSCTELESFTFENFDTSKVTQWMYCFYRTKLGDVDLSSISIESAVDFTSMFDSSAIKTLQFKPEDYEDDFYLDSVNVTYLMFQNAPNFMGFRGKKPKFRNVRNAQDMFKYTGSNRKNDMLEVTDMDFNNCINFQGMFYCSYYSAIDVSGLHSKVKNELVNMQGFMQSCSNLKYAFICDANFQTGVQMNLFFVNDKKLTFSSIPDYTDTTLAEYFKGNIPYLLKDGTRYPFDGFMGEGGYATTLNSAFQKCSYLRGMPDGFLDGIKTTTSTDLTCMFNFAFSEVIPASIEIPDDVYEELYAIYLPFEGLNCSFYQFKDATNVSKIVFKNAKSIIEPGTQNAYQNLTNLGKNSRLDYFIFVMNDFNYVAGFEGYGGWMYFNGRNFKTNGKDLKIYLSDDCSLAQTQKENYRGAFKNDDGSTAKPVIDFESKGCPSVNEIVNPA